MVAPYQVMPPLAAEDLAALRQSIKEHGVRQPVDVDEDGNILDGHNRAAIAKKLKVPFPTRINTGLTDEEKRTLAREMNVARRHLTSKQKRDLIDGQLADTPSLSDRAMAAQLSVDHKTVGKRRETLVRRGDIPHVDKRTDTLNRSQPVQRQKSYIIDDTPDGRAAVVKHAKKIRAENSKVNHELKMAHHASIAAAGVEAGSVEALQSSGPFSVVYADPEWKFKVRSEVTGHEKSAEQHYPTSDLEIIKSYQPPVADDALLFLWCTASNLVSHALPVVEAYGFTYITQIVWDKENIGTGFWVRDRHEILLICKRGEFPAPIMGTQPESVFSEKKGRHSAKPLAIRDLIASVYSPGLDASQRLEMNARDEHPDFQRWGFEA